MWGLIALLLIAGCGSVSVEDAPADPAITIKSVPTRIQVPSIGADSTLIQVTTDPSGKLQVPDVKTPKQGAWYKESAIPGEAGPGIYLAHVDGNGQPGLFARLSQVKEGAKVLITMDDNRTFVYTIGSITSVDKGSFPTEKVYGETPGSEIRLVTCGGPFVGGDLGYSNNVIAYGRLDQ